VAGLVERSGDLIQRRQSVAGEILLEHEPLTPTLPRAIVWSGQPS
jgi:hypothetical protein